MSTQKRIGIFRGTFDPIHKGHISFAEQAIIVAKLDELYFLPEVNPLHKSHVGKLEDRIDKISNLIAYHPKLKLLVDPHPHGSSNEIVSKLHVALPDSLLVFMMGSDIAKTLPYWSNLDVICKGNKLLVALRDQDSEEDIRPILMKLKPQPVETIIIKAPLPHLASSRLKNRSQG